jgi:hypothetical protein
VGVNVGNRGWPARPVTAEVVSLVGPNVGPEPMRAGTSDA